MYNIVRFEKDGDNLVIKIFKYNQEAIDGLKDTDGIVDVSQLISPDISKLNYTLIAPYDEAFDAFTAIALWDSQKNEHMYYSRIMANSDDEGDVYPTIPTTIYAADYKIVGWIGTSIANLLTGGNIS